MKIVFPMENFHALSGNVSVTLQIADVAKGLGHTVRLIGDATTTDPTPPAEQPPINHYPYTAIRDYYPLKHLEPADFEDIRGYYDQRGWDRMRDADLLWSFGSIMDNIEAHGEHDKTQRLSRHYAYVHWPSSPRLIPAPDARLFSNSTYTQAEVRRVYGRESEVLHPPIPADLYNPFTEFKDRDVDVAYVGRVTADKLGDPPAIAKLRGLRVGVAGAATGSSYEKALKLEWTPNATHSELRKLLSRSKVYVHWKGLATSTPEHLGITPLEAMASGCAVIVPRAGGPWTDIADSGRFCLGVDSVEEANVEAWNLCRDLVLWRKWSLRSRVGVRRFSSEAVGEQVEAALGGVNVI